LYPDSELKIDVFADNVAKSKICSGGVQVMHSSLPVVLMQPVL